jgi:NifU-like protein involved in Fe-S cluster formation
MTSDEIVERWKAPLYKGRLASPTHTATGRGKACDDVVNFDVEIKGNLIVGIKFQATACVMTTAMADILAETVEGQSIEFVRSLDPFALFGLPVTALRRGCITLPLEVLRVSLHL